MTALIMSTREFESKISDSLSRARQQPVVITDQGKPQSVLLSFEEYERLSALDRQVFRAGDLTEDDLSEISAARMEDGFGHLDAELKD